MRKSTVLFACCYLAVHISASAQQRQSLLYDKITAMPASGKLFESKNIFSRLASLPAGTNTLLHTAQGLSLNKMASFEIYSLRPKRLSLVLPFVNNKTYTLQLAEQDISFDRVAVYTLTGTGSLKKAGKADALHYRGFIEGWPASIAAVSIFKNGDLMILFSNEEGNFNLGKMSNSSSYVLYNSFDWHAKVPFKCSAVPLPLNSSSQHQRIPANITEHDTIPAPLLCKKPRFQWEADYKLYNNNFGGNLINTVNYITGLFNEVAVMFANEGITIELSSTAIWTSPSPYNTSSAFEGLSSIKGHYNALGNNFNGDFCMLIDGAPANNGGMAFIPEFDLCDRNIAYGYTNVQVNDNALPVYSQDIALTTHETGHLLGLYDAHWCGWKTGPGGTCGALDNCFWTLESIDCDSCTAAANALPTPPPDFIPSIMSYCYFQMNTDLSNGFGHLPQARMRSNITAASCFVKDNKWTGMVSTEWENPANWNCGSVPDENTDVTITNTVANFPIVNSQAACRRLQQKTSSRVTVNTGFSLKIAGTGN